MSGRRCLYCGSTKRARHRDHIVPKSRGGVSLPINQADSCWSCNRCLAYDGLPHPETKAKVVLTVAHLDHTPENCADENLRALCQACHNRYDAPMRAAGRKERREAASLQGKLFGGAS